MTHRFLIALLPLWALLLLSARPAFAENSSNAQDRAPAVEQSQNPPERFPVSNRTEEAKHGGAAEGAKHGGGEEPSIFNYALDLTIWTVIVFLCLLWILARYAWKPMLEGLQRREQNIRSAMEEAQRARDEAQALREQFQAEMNRSAEQVRDMMDAGRRDAQRLTDEMVSKARTEIQAERDRLRREIETARDQALQQLWNETARLATVISAKAIRRSLSGDDHRRLVDEAMAELRQVGNHQ